MAAAAERHRRPDGFGPGSPNAAPSASSPSSAKPATSSRTRTGAATVTTFSTIFHSEKQSAESEPSGRSSNCSPRTAAGPPEAAAARTRYDLRPGSPDLSAFPRSAWLRATRRPALAGPGPCGEPLEVDEPVGELARARAQPRPASDRRARLPSDARGSPRSGGRYLPASRCAALRSARCRTCQGLKPRYGGLREAIRPPPRPRRSRRSPNGAQRWSRARWRSGARRSAAAGARQAPPGPRVPGGGRGVAGQHAPEKLGRPRCHQVVTTRLARLDSPRPRPRRQSAANGSRSITPATSNRRRTCGDP